jgi:8-oxo-dGTP pyrophosphatase MutT (NUDIX family)/Fe-S-cluster containining protein
MDELIQIVDAALADAARRAGPWLVCRLGCTHCCMGVFRITARDAGRLREGLAAADPQRAARILQRAGQALARYNNDAAAMLRAADDDSEDAPCPVLDPDTGACDLYDARPLTCRTFGPPVRFEDGSLAVCELCFDGATEDQVAACEVEIDDALRAELEAEGDTTIALALSQPLADYEKIGLLTLRGDRMLLCRKKRTTSLLILPGGCLEPGESALECLARELREELGEVSVSGLEYIGSYSDRAAGSAGKTVKIELYRGDLVGEPAPHSEIGELVWFGESDDRALLAPSLVNRILPDLLARGILPWPAPTAAREA